MGEATHWCCAGVTMAGVEKSACMRMGVFQKRNRAHGDHGLACGGTRLGMARKVRESSPICALPSTHRFNTLQRDAFNPVWPLFLTAYGG